jgi:hypothetical protein
MSDDLKGPEEHRGRIVQTQQKLRRVVWKPVSENIADDIDQDIDGYQIEYHTARIDLRTVIIVHDVKLTKRLICLPNYERTTVPQIAMSNSDRFPDNPPACMAVYGFLSLILTLQ